MFLRKLTRLGVGALLGMFLPRTEGSPGVATVPAGAPGGDDAAAIERAAALEAANARVRELEGLTEEKIRQMADDRIHEIFPAIAVPSNDPPRRYARPDDGDGGGEPPAAPTLEERVAQIGERQNQIEIDRAADELNQRIDRAMEKYPMADKWRVMGWIAEAGDQPINVEKMVEVSHAHENRTFEERYAARRAAESNNTRENAPPRVPVNPGGVGVGGTPITSKNAAQRFMELARQKLPGWFEGK